MLGSATLDLAIGMAFIFLMLSLVVAALREAIEARLKDRALFLQRGLFELFGREAGFVDSFYKHPLISALYGGDYRSGAETISSKSGSGLNWLFRLLRSYQPSTTVTQLPSYIPTKTAVLAIIDMARTSQFCETRSIATGNPKSVGEAGGHIGKSEGKLADNTISLVELRTELKNQCPHSIVRAIYSVIAASGDDTDKGIKSIEAWYDASMDRVSGWFKRETQSILFFLGFLVAAALNVDAIFLTKFLASSPEMRSNLIAQVTAIQNIPELTGRIETLRPEEPILPSPAPAGSSPSVAPTPPVASTESAKNNSDGYKKIDEEVAKSIKNFSDLNLPLGWSQVRWNDFINNFSTAFWTIFGWFITAFALSFGAPFWFDVLNKFMIIRSTVKPHEKSPEESSEDRQTKPA